jgi:serpin B
MTPTARLLTRAGLAGSLLCGATVAGALDAGAAAAPDASAATTIVNGLGARLQAALAADATDPNANLVVSPFSVGVALTMTSAGAAGDTAAQMRDVLGLADGDEPHAALAALVAGIGHGDGSFSSANSLWTQADLAINAAFTDLLRDVYRSELMATDFSADPAAALTAVNEWVATQTAGRIPALLTEQQVTDLTRFILVNAVHLDATWAQPFDPYNTHADEFTRADGSIVEADFMGQTFHVDYAEQGDTQAIVLEYEEGYEMVVVLPAEGQLTAFEAALTDAGGDIDAVLGGFTNAEVSLDLPKWDIETRAGLVPQLESLGMTLPFDRDAADFSNITTEIPLFVSDVVHQANITVDEAGTEAAAATAVIGEVGAAPGPEPEPEIVDVDHPFFFAIRDSETGTILFQGHVNDPTAG